MQGGERIVAELDAVGELQDSVDEAAPIDGGDQDCRRTGVASGRQGEALRCELELRRWGAEAQCSTQKLIAVDSYL